MKCHYCHKDLPKSHFAKAKATITGRSYRCRECLKEYKRNRDAKIVAEEWHFRKVDAKDARSM